MVYSHFVKLERKRVPGDVLSDAYLLEWILVDAYDLHLVDDELPVL